jgi:hypothetical protein
MWPPTWHHATTGRGTARVLVEHPDPAMRELLARGLTQHGYRTITCAGPRTADARALCPLLADEACPAVSGADAVVFGLDARDPDSRRVLDRLHEMHDGRRILHVIDPHPALQADFTNSQHTLNRTVIAPLVRRLYDALA